MNVISYCIFGNRDLDWKSVPGVVRAHHNIFPGWEMRVHCDSSAIPRLDGYRNQGLMRLVDCGSSQKVCLSMLWRLKPLWDNNVGYLLARDMDSLPLPKDRRAVEEFMKSGCIVHSLGDNRAHYGLMGGMCGFNVPRMRGLLTFSSWEHFVALGRGLETRNGGDQNLMNTVIAPLVKGSICEHHFQHGGHVALKSLRLPDVAEKVQNEGDRMAPYIGAAGFDADKAVTFFDENGYPDVAERAAAAAEKGPLRETLHGLLVPEPAGEDIGFFTNLTGWDNHRPLLYAALKITDPGKGLVMEMGSGFGSTPLLREYCARHGRKFLTFESKKDWAEKTGSMHIGNWDSDSSWVVRSSVAFIDHAPGEHRWKAISKLAAMADVLVIHDSEPAATGYMLDKIWGMFAYRVNIESAGAWSSMVSRTIDFRFLRGKVFNGIKFT